MCATLLHAIGDSVQQATGHVHVERRQPFSGSDKKILLLLLLFLLLLSPPPFPCFPAPSASCLGSRGYGLRVYVARGPSRMPSSREPLDSSERRLAALRTGATFYGQISFAPIL